MSRCIRNQWWCSSAGTSWTKRISSANPTPSSSSTGAMRMAREYPPPPTRHPFPLPPSFLPFLSPFMCSVKSCSASRGNWFHWFASDQKPHSPFKHVCELHVEVFMLCVLICVCLEGGGIEHVSPDGMCVCVHAYVRVRSSFILLSALQCMTSQIRPCALRAEDTKSTCQPRD